MISLEQNEQIQPMPQQSIFQVDRCFYDSAIKISNKYYDLYKIHSLRFIVMVIVCFYDRCLRSPLQSDNPCVFVLILCFLWLQFMRSQYCQHILKTFQHNIPKIQTIAGRLNHGKTITSLISYVQDPFEYLYIRRSRLKVSKNVYSYGMVFVGNDLQNMLAKQIQAQNCVNQLERVLLVNWFEILELIFTVVTIQFTFIIVQFYQPQLKIILLSYLLSEFYLRSKIFVIMILLHIIIPLIPICCLCLCYYDYHNIKSYLKNLIKRVAQLPKSVPATQEIIEKAQGTCSICIEEITLGQQVVNLKCSDKHVFHQLCIQDWTKIRKNCPICRSDL